MKSFNRFVAISIMVTIVLTAKLYPDVLKVSALPLIPIFVAAFIWDL